MKALSVILALGIFATSMASAAVCTQDRNGLHYRGTIVSSSYNFGNPTARVLWTRINGAPTRQLGIIAYRYLNDCYGRPVRYKRPAYRIVPVPHPHRHGPAIPYRRF